MNRSDPTPWIRSPAWDALWIFSGLWAPVLMGLGCVGFWLWSGVTLPARWTLLGEIEFYYLFLALGVLHRMSTIYAVLATPLLREGIRREPGRYLYVPGGILIGSLTLGLGFAFHGQFSFLSQPRGQLWAFFVLAFVFFLWERWHFCMQEFGVLSIYRVRAGQAAKSDRRFDLAYAVIVMLVVNVALLLCFGVGAGRALLAGTPLEPSRNVETLLDVAFGALLLGMAAMLVAVTRELLRPDRSLPKAVFYVLVGSHMFVLYHYPRAYGLFFLANVFHHWMVAVGLFSQITFKAYGAPSRLAAARTFLVRVGPFFAACLLFYVFFGSFDRSANPLPLPDTSLFAGTSSAYKLGIALVTGLFFAFNFLHYYYDRCMYRFSDPVVRRSVGPLLFGPGPERA